MLSKTSLYRGAALGAMLAMGAGLAHAETATKHKKVVHKKAEHVAAATGGELAALRAEVRDLQTRLDAQAASQAQTQAQAQQAAAAAQAAQEQIQTAQAQDADATAAIIQSIPVAVAAEVDKNKPKTDALYIKGVKLSLGGFIEAAGIYRSHNVASDVGTPFNSVPFAQSRQGHAEEIRGSARQSRISGMAEGQVNDDLKLTAYGEFDFLGAAQTANSNQSNSFNLRTRVVYAQADWANEGWHLLAGDSWSLATMNSKGITPRNEVLPPTIDSQYNVGYVWARQPQFRVTKDLFNKSLWIAGSVEMPQTIFGGSAPTAANVITTVPNGAQQYAGATSSGAAATQSINHIPDLIAKAATEQDFMGHHVHGEVFGIYRSFYEQYANFKSNNLNVGGVGGGIAAQVLPGLLDAQVTGLTGPGMGRYGTSTLPDVAFTSSGKLSAVQDTSAMFTVTAHATKTLDLSVIGGEEFEARPAEGHGSYGNFTSVNSGCNIQGSPLTCTGNTRMLQEITFQAWDKAYQGPWGYLRVGLQYSYVNREAFSGVGGAPTGHEDIIETSFRYYPFQ
jgi:type II secretory pathway pseudopilin PulG